MGAQPRPLPLPRSLQDVLADSERHGAPQDREGKGRHEEASDLRGGPTPIRQEEEDGRSLPLKVLRLKPGRKFCSLGRLSHDVGWKYQDVIETLEAKRKVKAQDFYNRTVTKAKAVAEAEKAVA